MKDRQRYRQVDRQTKRQRDRERRRTERWERGEMDGERVHGGDTDSPPIVLVSRLTVCSPLILSDETNS